MRIVLLYPPPWKIPGHGQSIEPDDGGPPPQFRAGDLDADFFQTPYGLLSLAAQARAAGHQVKLLNLASYPWSDVRHIIGRLEADLFGLSCYTANRRGVALAAQAIRQQQPLAHIVVGGPHASALPRQMLAHHQAIDTVVIGEGEGAFAELLERLDAGKPSLGIEGTAFRDGQRTAVGPARRRIGDLDELVSPHEYFDTHLVLTSRGCPGQCTFCAKDTVWGKSYRALSVPRTLDTLARALDRLPVKMLTVKDDTFTANRKRGLLICQGIRQRKLNFIWSCDTRADALDDELARQLRLAGCQRLSFGVESGSPTILRNIRKRITPDEIQQATAVAKRYGLQVRYYMMLGNRGETADTFQQSLDFVRQASPHQYLFACLSIYPGTEDFRELVRGGWLDSEIFFTDSFQELKEPYDASKNDTLVMAQWFDRNRGLHQHYVEGIDEYQAILARLGDFHGAHLDLGGAYYRDGQYDAATEHLHRALELGHPLPGLIHNYLACIAAADRRWPVMQQHLSKARNDPLHPVVQHNLRAVKQWQAQSGLAKNHPLELVARHDFQLFERTRQPVLPGPVDEDFATWGRPPAPGSC